MGYRKMKHSPKCPYWDKKNQKCKLMDIVEELSRSNTLLAQAVEAYGAQTTILGPVPGSHGQIEGSSPIPQPPNELLEGLGKIGSLFHPPPDQKLSHWGEEEEQKEKQEYWEKELEKMDEKEKK